MSYIENPKTAGSNIICCIPQETKCPMKCFDCFFLGGRSYLEPLEKNIPNMPTLEEVGNRIVRVNDGNDSGVEHEKVLRETEKYPKKFYNTSLPEKVKVLRPCVFTVNPGRFTDLKISPRRLLSVKWAGNVMFVRIRVNTWNLINVEEMWAYYDRLGIPIVLNPMAYHKLESIPPPERKHYEYRVRHTNEYWCMKKEKLHEIMNYFDGAALCGNLKDYPETQDCKNCRNCENFYALWKSME